MRFTVLLILLLAAGPASAVTIDWVTVGDPGNACDPQTRGCFGAVSYEYQVSKYEVTNGQYVEFLNAVASSDPNGLYNVQMADTSTYDFAPGYGGIERNGTPGSFSYNVIPGRGSLPVNWVSFYDALRFANWMHNGQGAGDTETGAYTLLGGTATPSNWRTVTRNPGANIFLPSEDEWYKAAYYDPLSTSFFNFPAGTNTWTACAAPGATVNTANCGSAVGDLTDVGSYTGSPSPYGTFDQGGNVGEWNEAISDDGSRGVRGGMLRYNAIVFAASFSLDTLDNGPWGEIDFIGFRVASVIPEPSTATLVGLGLAVIAARRSAKVG